MVKFLSQSCVQVVKQANFSLFYEDNEKFLSGKFGQDSFKTYVDNILPFLNVFYLFS